MQISDGTDYLSHFFVPGEEIIGYSDADDLVDKLKYYLENEPARARIARAGYDRVMREYTFATVTRKAADLIAAGMQRINWTPQLARTKR
jgi:spore maturation protein CgeB